MFFVAVPEEVFCGINTPPMTLKESDDEK